MKSRDFFEIPSLTHPSSWQVMEGYNILIRFRSLTWARTPEYLLSLCGFKRCSCFWWWTTMKGKRYWRRSVKLLATGHQHHVCFRFSFMFLNATHVIQRGMKNPPLLIDLKPILRLPTHRVWNPKRIMRPKIITSCVIIIIISLLSPVSPVTCSWAAAASVGDVWLLCLSFYHGRRIVGGGE